MKSLLATLVLLTASVFGQSTFTPNLNLEKPAHDSSDWDGPLNSNFDKIDTSVVLLTPSGNQSILGGFDLLNNSGCVGAVNTSATPSNSFLKLCVDGTGNGILNAGVSNINFNPNGTIILNPTGAGSPGTSGVLINNSGLEIAGTFATTEPNGAVGLQVDKNAMIIGAGGNGIPVLFLGSATHEGIIQILPGSGGGSYNIRAPATGSSFQITLPAASGTLALTANTTLTGSTNIAALTITGINGSVQCLHVNSSGTISGTGADCGAGGGGGGGSVTSVSGTVGQVTVVNGSTTPTISIPSPFTFPGTVTNNLSIFGSTTSAQLFAVLSDETGSSTGTPLAVFNQSPVIVTPSIASFINATHDHSNAANGGNLTSAAFVNQGTTNQVLHGNATGAGSFGAVTNADIAAATIDVTTKITGIVPAGNGGTTNAFTAFTGPAGSIKTFTLPNASATILTSAAAVSVVQGGLGITAGTSGGVPCFTGATTIASGSALTANLPVIGGGAGVCPSSGSRSGNTTVFATTTGTLTSTHVAGFDVSGNIVDIGLPLSNPMSTLGDMISGGAGGAPARVTGAAAPDNVPQFLISTPASGVATAPVFAFAGVATNAQTGTTYTIASTDRAHYVSTSNASSIVTTLPQANTSGFGSNFVFVTCDIGAGTNTITPTTSTISFSTGGAYTSGASTLALTTGQCAWIYSDNTNYFAIKFASGAGTVTSVAESFTGGIVSVGGSPITGSGTLALTVAGTSGGLVYFNSSTTWASSAALTANSPILGGGAGAAPATIAGITSDGTSVLVLGVAGTSAGGIDLKNATSGTISIRPPTGALGTVTLTAPAATDTLVARATTDTLTNKTINASNNTLSNITGAMMTNNTVTATQLAVVQTRRVCSMAFGDTSGSALTNAQLGPQKRLCYIPYAATVVEIDVAGDAGTPNIIVGRSRAGVTSNLLSSALATAASGGIACSNTGGTTGLDAATTCSSTLQNTGTNIGDYFEAVSGTAGGTAKLMTVQIVYTVN